MLRWKMFASAFALILYYPNVKFSFLVNESLGWYVATNECIVVGLLTKLTES